MSDFIAEYKHMGGLSDALQLARAGVLANIPDPAVSTDGPPVRQPAVSPGPLTAPSLPSSPGPEQLGWRVLWIERTEIQHGTQADAAAEFEAERRLGEQLSRPGLTVSNYLQRLDSETGVWISVRKAERPEWMLSQ